MQGEVTNWDAEAIAWAVGLAVLPRVVPADLVLETLEQLAHRVVKAFTEPGTVNLRDRAEVGDIFHAVLDENATMGPWCVDQVVTEVLAHLDMHSASQSE